MPSVKPWSATSALPPQALPPGPSAAAAAAGPRPQLTQWDVVTLVVGLVIGAGIFTAPALVAAHAGSPTQMLVAWVAGGVISLAGALCYAEMAAAHPHAGGDYHYLRLAFGEKVSFLFAWARLTVIPTGSIALLGYVFGDYATGLYDLGPHSPALYAAGMVLALTVVNVVGLNAGRLTQRVLTLVELAGIAAIIAAGLLLPATGPVPASTVAAVAADTPAAQWGLVLIFVMLTYGGWNEAAYLSAEVAGSRRSLPRALFWSICAVTAVYLLVNLAFLKTLGLAGMAASETVAARAMEAVLGSAGGQFISALVAVTALASANATILTGARTGYAFGRDTPMFAALGRWNARCGTPATALAVQGAITLALVALGAAAGSGFVTMVEYTAPVFWLFFTLTGIAFFVLRRRHPGARRAFKVPLYPLTPLVFCASSLYLLYASLAYTGIGALAGLAVLAVGALLLALRRPRPAAVALAEACEPSPPDNR